VTPFRHAVASFEPTDSAVLLWTRLTGATEARWVLARDPDLQDVVQSGSAVTGPARDFTVVVDVEGLEPATTYWYRFEVGEDVSPTGRTRTLPGAGVEAVDLGLVSCARYSVAPLTVYRVLAEREVDLVVHVGDYVYEDDGHKGHREHRPPHRAVSLEDYRQRLAQVREDEDCQAVHLRHPFVTVLDDHDVADNAWRGGAKAHDPLEDGPWSARAEAALRARSEWLPTRDPRLYRSLELGDLGRLVLLDTRLEGRDQQAGEPGVPSYDDPERSLLGDEQRAWLREQLDDPRPWSVVANGVVVNSLELPGAAPAALLPEDYALHDGHVLRSDLWDGYEAEREALLDLVVAREGGTLLVSGDVHSSWAFDGPCRDGEPVTNEVVVPSVSSAPLGRTRLPGLWRLLDALADRMPHVVWSDLTERGFVHLRLTAVDAQATWHWVDPYATDLSPASEAAASFRVEVGRPRWERVSALSLARSSGPPLPPRPADVAEVRHWHQRRRYAGLAGVSAVFGSAAVVAARRWLGSSSPSSRS
jgi:alkaline phosphatase D